MNTLKNETKNFGYSFMGQFKKNMHASINTGYLLIIMIVMGSIFLVLLYTKPVYMGFFFSAAVRHNFLYFPLRLDITFPLAIFRFFILSFMSVIPLILPIIVISNDFESRNFDILRTTKFNSLGYYLANIAYTLLICFIIILEMTYMSEGVIFYSGYSISSGFLIDPFIVALPYMLFIIVPASVAVFISTVSGNRTISIILFLFLSFMSSGIIASQIHRLYDGSTVNDLLFLLSPYTSFLSVMPHLLHIIPSLPNASQTLENFYQTFHPPMGYVYVVLYQSTTAFFTAGFVVLFAKRNSTRIVSFIKSKIRRNKVRG